LDLYFGVAQELTREQVVIFRFQSARPGIWKIGVVSDYEEPMYHMWLPIRQFLSEPVEFLQPEPNITVCNPGTGKDTLTVSAYDVADDALYLQAGRGFTPNGDVKPVIVAPGVNIVGVFPKNRYETMSGTGVATAFSAGVAALFMQQYEHINGIAVREIFIRGATPRGTPYPNTEWGYGIVNAYESLFDVY
jgi:subtilisin family serine protease